MLRERGHTKISFTLIVFALTEIITTNITFSATQQYFRRNRILPIYNRFFCEKTSVFQLLGCALSAPPTCMEQEYQVSWCLPLHILRFSTKRPRLREVRVWVASGAGGAAGPSGDSARPERRNPCVSLQNGKMRMMTTMRRMRMMSH